MPRLEYDGRLSPLERDRVQGMIDRALAEHIEEYHASVVTEGDELAGNEEGGADAPDPEVPGI